MSRLLLLSVLCLAIGCAIAATPTKPVISPTFHAQVSVALRDGTKAYRGGGIYAYDIKNNRAREDYRLEDQAQHEHYISVHFLERYDLHEVFTINGENTKCTKQPVNGQLENPWDWVEKATFVGTNTFRGQSTDEWKYVDGTETTLLSVKTSDTTIPVFLQTHDKSVNNTVTQLDITFEEFDTNEPQAWVFYVPQICNTTTELVGGDKNAVVYFANNNWNCANVACSSRVAAGTGQPAYECAEFAARSLAAGAYLPGLTSTAPQSHYSDYKGNNLCLVTGLSKALTALGFKKEGTTEAAYAVFGDGGDGAWSHACIGVGANTVDCHNNARKGNTATGIMYKGINEILAP